MGKRREAGPTGTHLPYPYLGAVEITQVCIRVPAWAACTLIDVHTLEIYVHLHLPPMAVNWYLGT
jgi:hypothetical protein